MLLWDERGEGGRRVPEPSKEIFNLKSGVTENIKVKLLTLLRRKQSIYRVESSTRLSEC